ncbi:MAG: hypothetical protein AB3N18_18995 [Allomuricauda sp.]
MSKQQFENLTELIKDGYATPDKMANVLDLGVEMLFYVEEGAFSQREIQHVVTAIRDIVGVLRGAVI